MRHEAILRLLIGITRMPKDQAMVRNGTEVHGPKSSRGRPQSSMFGATLEAISNPVAQAFLPVRHREECLCHRVIEMGF